MSDEKEALKRVEPGEPDQSSLYTLVENGAMLVGGTELSEQEKKIVELYIIGLGNSDDTGAGDDDVDDGDLPAPPVQLVNFEKVKQGIFISHCIRCHRSFEKESDLDRYIDKNDPLNSALLDSVEFGFMPL